MPFMLATHTALASVLRKADGMKREASGSFVTSGLSGAMRLGFEGILVIG